MIHRIHSITSKRRFEPTKLPRLPRARADNTPKVSRAGIVTYYAAMFTAGSALTIVAFTAFSGVATFIAAWAGISLIAAGVWTFLRRLRN